MKFGRFAYGVLGQGCYCSSKTSVMNLRIPILLIFHFKWFEPKNRVVRWRSMIWVSVILRQTV